nr:E-beta-farnesene synthase [Tanacetum cinerariifolium]
MSRHTTGKKSASLILIPSISFTKLIIHHLQMRHKFHPRPDSPLHLSDDEPVLGYLKFSAKGTKREVFRMPIPGSLITADIREASYHQEYQANVAKHKRFMAGETGSAQGSPAPKPAKHARKPKPAAQKAPSRPLVSTPVASAQPAPISAPAKPQENKRKQATKTTDKPAKAKRIKHSAASTTHTDYQKALEESMKAAYALPRGPLPPVVIREPESEKYQPLPEVPGKGKAKVTEEQVAHDLLSLQKAKRKSPVEQYILQKRIFEPAGSSFRDESPYVVFGQSDSEEESEKVVLGATEGELLPVRPSLGLLYRLPDRPGLAGNAGNDEQSIPSPVVHTGSDREHIDLDVTDVSPQPSTEQLDEGFFTTAYPKIQECLKLAVEEQVLLEEPASSSGTLSSLHHLSRDISFGDQFFSNKPLDADKYAETKVESMLRQLSLKGLVQQSLWMDFLNWWMEVDVVVVIGMIQKLQELLMLRMVLLVEEEEVADEPSLARVPQSDHGSSTFQELQTAACVLHEIVGFAFPHAMMKDLFHICFRFIAKELISKADISTQASSRLDIQLRHLSLKGLVQQSLWMDFLNWWMEVDVVVVIGMIQKLQELLML